MNYNPHPSFHPNINQRSHPMSQPPRNNRRHSYFEGNKEQNYPSHCRLRQRRPELDDIAISKHLAFILRHPKNDSRLKMNDEGYIYVKDILKERRFSGYVDKQDILRIVECNDKRRFSLKYDCYGDCMIRACQGHSVELNLHLETILHPDHFPVVVHGTTHDAWQFIRTEGLRNTNRSYIHFAIGLPGDGVVSGIRNSSEICIFINLEKAMHYGLKFFLSENFVVLSKGDEYGIIKPIFFSHVIDRKTNQPLM